MRLFQLVAFVLALVALSGCAAISEQVTQCRVKCATECSNCLAGCPTPDAEAAPEKPKQEPPASSSTGENETSEED
jgi:hypothetical protein